MAQSTTRRGVLGRGIALLGSITALSGCLDSLGGGGEEGGGDGEGGGSEENGESEDGDGGGNDGGDTRTIGLGAETGGWQGQEPSDIEGETNPELSLQAGTAHELTWENLDGEEHELIIEDADGNELEASDSAEEEGEAVTLTFDATEEMAQYYCEYHPDAMRGEIAIE